MAVNGIEIAVGQVWVTAANREVEIVNKSVGRGAPWKIDQRNPSGYIFATDDGYLTNGDRLVDLHENFAKLDMAAAFGAWTAWSGGTCPVPKGVRVDVKFRGGAVAYNASALTRASMASAAFWHHDETPTDIVAYRLAQCLPNASEVLVNDIQVGDDHEALTFHPLPVAEPEQSNQVTTAQVNDGAAYDPDVALQRRIDANDGVGYVAPANGIGDVHSDVKGSGARYNTGKAPLDLIPLSLLAAFYTFDMPDSESVEALSSRKLTPDQLAAVKALDALGIFQAREGNLLPVMLELGDSWDECAQVFDYGRKKYAAWNWAKGMAWSVPIACAARHLAAIIRGENTDPESGLSHRGHVMCNLVMLATYEATFAEGDDRPTKGLLL